MVDNPIGSEVGADVPPTSNKPPTSIVKRKITLEKKCLELEAKPRRFEE